MSQARFGESEQTMLTVTQPSHTHTQNSAGYKPANACCGKLKRNALVTFVTLFGWTSVAHADAFYSDFFNPRAMGMGGHSVTISNDEYAPFGNPAGLARVAKPRNKETVKLMTLPGLVLVTNSQTVRSVRGGRLSLTRLLNQAIQSSGENPGIPSFVSLQAYPAVVLGGSRGGPLYLFGLTSKTDVASLFSQDQNDPAQATGVFTTQTTVGAVLGLGVSTYGGTLSAGATVRPQVRYKTSQGVSKDDSTTLRRIFDNTKSGAQKSFALASDVGVQLRAMDFWLPTLGLAVRNIPTGCLEGFENTFSKKTVTMCGVVFGGSGEVAPMETRVGVSVTPRVTLGRTRLNLRLGAEMGPLGIVSGDLSWGYAGVNVNRLVHLGSEIFLGDASVEPDFALRSGYNQGFLTFGATLRLWALQLDLATSVEDQGEGTKRRGDRSYLVGLSTQL